VTKKEPEERLHKFYTLLHTPVGEEYKLKEQGIPMIMEGDFGTPSDRTESLEENGQSLLLVDLLSLPKKFTFKRYREDIVGFLKAMLFVAGILVIGWLTTII
jgi:hypothetical protein